MVSENSLNLAAQLRQAHFVLGAARLAQLPEDTGCEVLWVGRSNVGKSSVLNALTGRHKLARVSKTPGRTQQLNVFALDMQRRLIDAPGYGYAETPPAQRAYWRVQLATYLQHRQALRGVVWVMDIRQPLAAADQEFLELLNITQRPCHILLNKADKLSRMQALRILHQTHALLEQQPGCYSTQCFSALNRDGVESLLAVLAPWLTV